MSKVIAITNQKGGVGKTTTTISFGVELYKQGKKVLLIDGDQQANLTYALGIKNPDDLTGTLGSLMAAEMAGIEYPTEDLILKTKEGVDIIPSSVELAAIEIPMMSAMNREYILNTIIDKVKNNYDYILIDSPPSLGLMTINILTASNSVLIPVNAEIFSMVAMQQLFNTIRMIRKKLNADIGVEGILFTMIDIRTTLCRQAIEKVIDDYGNSIRIFNTQIPRSIKASETVSFGLSVTSYMPNSKIGIAYRELTKEFLKNKKAPML